MIKLKVEYYGNEHEKMLSKLSCATELTKVVKNGLLIPEQDFLVYSLFREQKRMAGWKTYKELAEKVPSRLEIFNDYFGIENGYLYSKFSSSNDTDKTMTEAVGVGTSLSLASIIYGLTEADWEKIPVTKNKDLDFQIASTGQEIVELESKGAIVTNTNYKREISGRANDIHKKKSQQRNKHDNNNTLLGIIATIPITKGQETVCQILDPEGDNIEISPRKYKLLARLLYYYREFRILTRAHFLISLVNRIQAIQVSEDYDSFDNQPLLNIDNEPFINITPSLKISKSVVEDGLAFGEIISLGNNNYYYYGFLFSIIDILINQGFSNILAFRNNIELPRESNILVHIRRSEAESFGISESEFEGRQYFEMRMRGQLSITASGKVIGRCSRV